MWACESGVFVDTGPQNDLEEEEEEVLCICMGFNVFHRISCYLCGFLIPADNLNN